MFKIIPLIAGIFALCGVLSIPLTVVMCAVHDLFGMMGVFCALFLFIFGILCAALSMIDREEKWNE